MLEKRFDIRFMLLAVLVNGGVVFFINLSAGGTNEASMSGIVQLFVSGILAGFTLPYAKRQAYRTGTTTAYFYGSVVMAMGVACFGWLLHWLFETPDLFWTVIWNFGLNAIAGVVLVYLKRNTQTLPYLLARLAERL